MSNIFGLDALTSLAVAGSQVPGIELGTAVVPTYPRHPAVLAQQALTAALAAGPGRLTLGIGLSHKIVIEDMYGYSFDRPARHNASRAWLPEAVTPAIEIPRRSETCLLKTRPTGRLARPRSSTGRSVTVPGFIGFRPRKGSFRG